MAVSSVSGKRDEAPKGLTMRRRCVPGQPRDIRRGAKTGPRVRLWKWWWSTSFPFFLDVNAGTLTNSILAGQLQGLALIGDERETRVPLLTNPTVAVSSWNARNLAKQSFNAAITMCGVYE